MTIRAFAAQHGWHIKGRLKYIGIADHIRLYIDEDGNRYYRDTITKYMSIVSKDRKQKIERSGK